MYRHKERDYVLGTNEAELQRLGLQHYVWRPVARRPSGTVVRGLPARRVGGWAGTSSGVGCRRMVRPRLEPSRDAPLLRGHRVAAGASRWAARLHRRLGGVKTHPAARRCGYSVLGLRRAIEFFRDQPGIDFALLMCEQRLIRYYSRLGWQELACQLFINQHGAAIEFNFNRVIVCGVRAAAPLAGTIDLLGPPW